MNWLASAAILLASGSLGIGADAPKWQGAWSATAGGAAFAGTWSAAANAATGETPDTVAGTWSLRDKSGVELASGTWTAAKDVDAWRGAWKARHPTGQIYSGTWEAQVDLPMAAHLSDLFEAAIAKVANGSWRMGNNGGAWAIRTYPRK